VNLGRRGWGGSTQCMFCASDENISHLLFNCPVARYIWSVFQCTFNSPVQPRNSSDLGRWVNKFVGLEKTTVKLCLAGPFGKLETKLVLIIYFQMILVKSFIRFVIELIFRVNYRN
jgi:hypothetical protein